METQMLCDLSAQFPYVGHKPQDLPRFHSYPVIPTAAITLSTEDAEEHGELPDAWLGFLRAVVQIRAKEHTVAFGRVVVDL